MERNECGITEATVKKTVKDTTFTLSKEALIDLKKKFKEIRFDIMPCLGEDSKSIRSHLDALDILVDVYLKRFDYVK